VSYGGMALERLCLAAANHRRVAEREGASTGFSRQGPGELASSWGTGRLMACPCCSGSAVTGSDTRPQASALSSPMTISGQSSFGHRVPAALHIPPERAGGRLTLGRYHRQKPYGTCTPTLHVTTVSRRTDGPST
jgi:hypothetical protein